MLEISPFVDEGLGNSSYLVELGGGRALVVDPTRDIGPYVAAAERRRLRITHSLETHLHADFVSGSREVARLGGEVLAPAAGDIAFPHRGLEDGEEIDVDGLILRAIGTPGHTPEHLSYLVLDGARPLALFSGGALLVDSVARTDLISPEQTGPLARALYRSLRDRILSLPDDLSVYPTHGAGSFCSASVGGERTTTIGQERAANPLLRVPNEEAFVRQLLAGFGSYPGYFLRLREVNRHGPRVIGPELPVLARLSPGEFQRHLTDGAELVDARPIEAFAAGHIPGALSIALRDAFAPWLGWLIAMEQPLLFVLDGVQDRDELVRQCLKIGFERLVGELAGGMDAWRAAGLPEARITASRDPAALPGQVVDVRQRSEYVSGHVPDAVAIELGSLAADPERAGRGSATVMCGHGERAMTGASLLQRAGASPAVFLGGPREWSRATGGRLASEQ